MPTLIKSKIVATESDLPSTLEVGCKYFIEDTGQVIVDMGDGAKKYGGISEYPTKTFTIAANSWTKDTSASASNYGEFVYYANITDSDITTDKVVRVDVTFSSPVGEMAKLSFQCESFAGYVQLRANAALTEAVSGTYYIMGRSSN